MDRRLVVLVDLMLAPEGREEFAALARENAAASLRDEPGCRQFDVLLPEDGPDNQVILYEVYDDDSAFRAHLETSHYARFAAATAPLVRSKAVRRLRFAAGE